MHNIEYYTYSENVNKKKVQSQLDDYVAHEDWQEGCCGLFHDIRWLGDKVYSNSEEAHQAIERLDRGNYDQLAVKYIYHHDPDDDKRKAMEQKIRDTYKEYERRSSILYANTVTSAYIGCKKCGSRLSRTHLKSNACPLCREELRPDHMLKSVASAKAKWERAQRDLTEYREKKGKKEVLWLVKIEYHT